MDMTKAYEFLEEGIGYVPETKEDLGKGLEYKGFGEEGLEGKAKEEAKEAEEEAHELVTGGLRQALNLSPDQSLVLACQPTPDEMGEIERKVKQEEEEEYIYVLIDSLIEILLHLGEELD